MEKPLPLVLVVIFATTVLSGCFGGDDTELRFDDTDDTDATTGTVEGRVLTTSLEEIVGARVQLVQGGDLVEEAETSETGAYTIQGVEPGEYRIQVSAACCRQEARALEVVAGETANVDLQLSPYTPEDLRESRVESFEWTGFLSCGYTAGAVVGLTGEACSELDESSDFHHRFDLFEGLETVVIGVDWDPAGGTLGEDLRIFMEEDGCGLSCPDSSTYAQKGGSPQLEVRVDDPGGEISFDSIEVNRTIQYRVFPDFFPETAVDFYYQQEFTVYWDMYYWESAPEGATALPDL